MVYFETRRTVAAILITIYNIIVSLICIRTFSASSVYSSLYILPLLYQFIIVAVILLVPDGLVTNWGFRVYVIQSLVRCELSPLLLALGEGKSIFTDISSNDVRNGVFLLLLEQFACMIVLLNYKKNSSRARIEAPIKLNIVLIILLCTLVLSYITPDIAHQYSTIVDIVRNRIKTPVDITAIQQSRNQSAIILLLVLLIKSLRILVPTHVIQRTIGYDAKIRIPLLGLLLVAQFLLISDTIAESFISCIVIYIYASSIGYTLNKRPSVQVILILICTSMLIFSYSYETSKAYYNVQNIYQYTSFICQSYFTAIPDIASIFRLGDYPRITVLVHTLFSSIPFNTHFGDFSYNLNSIFTSIPGLKGQIYPTIAGSYYIFGPALAPIVSCCFLRGALHSSDVFFNRRNEYIAVAYLYFAIILASALGVYNIQIVLSSVCQTGIPILVVSAFSK